MPRVVRSRDADGGGSQSSSPDLSASASEAEPYLLGFVLANIVGLRHYSGTIRGRETVGLVREPLNPYDSNAIKVLNTRGVQVGHVDRATAASLAPLLDSRLVILEAIVPVPPRSANSFRVSFQIHLFARPAAEAAVFAAVSSSGLNFISHSDPEFGLSAFATVQEVAENPEVQSLRIDEIFAFVNNVKPEIKPLEPPKAVITTELFEHQKEGLGWLVQCENSTELPPFWEERDNGFLNVLTKRVTLERPEPLKAGIFADDMGLGKTLTLLSLIATNGLSKPKGLKPGKGAVASRRKRKADGKVVENEVSGPNATLVVCPKSVLVAWITQLEQHTRPGSLSVYLYHQERTQDPEEFSRHDIVLTTYNTLASEFGKDASPLLMVHWLRVILDEAHVIKNFSAKQTKAAIALKAMRRWVVTGTPIQNTTVDLFSLMAFLRFHPFSTKSCWRNLVQSPLDHGHKRALTRLQDLIGTIALRRTKDVQKSNKIVAGLPPKTIETCFVELSPEEREQYDQMESEAQNTVREYIDADTVLRNYSTVLQIILRLRQICNDVSLCPTDINTLISSNAIEDVSKNPELLMKLASIVEDGDDFDCPICLSPPARTVITCCAHIFCRTCIMKILKEPNAHCPLCRGAISKSDLFIAPVEKPSNVDGAAPSGRPISSKVSTLLELLQASKRENGSRKSVVFSQFRKMLILLEETLKASGFEVLRLDGSMSMKKRTEVMKEFEKSGPHSPTVLLASMKVAGAGINLTAASRVYLVDPWWNPAVEEQAMDRVHRIGQLEEVRVVRLIVRNSIEERVLELQEKKKQLASGAFGKKAANEQAQMRVEDIRTMIRL